MNFNEFINKYEGKGVDYDGNGKYWCVDLARQYVKEVLQLPQFPLVVGAADIWTCNLGDKYFKITNTPDGIPENGDIVIWSKAVGGGYGHVAIFISGGINSFISLDQNWPTGSLTKKTGHYYKNVLGWLRPKGGSMGDSPELTECLRQHTILVDKCVKLEQQVETLKSNAEADKKDFEAEKKALNGTLEGVRKELSDCKETHQHYLEDRANQLSVPLDMIVEEIDRLIVAEDAGVKAVNQLREERLDWEKKRIGLEGEIAKLQSKLDAQDLSEKQYRQLIKAFIRKLVRDLMEGRNG